MKESSRRNDKSTTVHHPSQTGVPIIQRSESRNRTKSVEGHSYDGFPPQALGDPPDLSGSRLHRVRGVQTTKISTSAPEMKLPCVYILASPDKSGQWHAIMSEHTDNLESRLAAHDAGALPGYTRDKRPGEFFDESRSCGTGKADQGLDQAEEGGADSWRLGSFTDACQGGGSTGSPRTGTGSPRTGVVRPEADRKEVL